MFITSIIQKCFKHYRIFVTYFTYHSAWNNPFSPVFLAWYYLQKRTYQAQSFFRGITLDIGCGRKPYIDIIKKKSRYIGFDYPQLVFDHKMLKKNLQPEIYGNGFYLPFKSESVDCILNTQVMEYINEPDNFIREMIRVLKPGGNIVMSIPFTYPIHHSSNDLFRYTQSGITYLLKNNGLIIIWIKANGGFWITIGQLFLYFLNFKFLFRTPHDILWILFGCVRLILLPFILIINCIINVLMLLCNIVFPEPYLTVSYSLVAQKKKK